MSKRLTGRLIGAVLAPVLVLMPLVAPASPDHTKSITLPVLDFRGPSLINIRRGLDLAYAHLGVKTVYVQVPLTRSLVEANEGRLDGAIVRSTLIEAEYPNLLRVDVPVVFTTIRLFARKSEKGMPMTLDEAARATSVGIVRGLRAPEDITKAWPNVLAITDYEMAARMLLEGRIDALIANADGVSAALKALNVDEQAFSSNVVQRIPLYHYLHKRHATLLPRITRELKKLKGKEASLMEGLQKSRPNDFPL